MMEMQRTLDGQLVPTAPHRDDLVECSNGSVCPRHAALFDVTGCAHRTDEERFEGNVAAVRIILEEAEKWSEEYHTGNSDYPTGFGYIVDECKHEWPRAVKNWFIDKGDIYGRTEHDDYLDELISYICKELDGGYDCEPEFGANEYAAYSGPGCCLFSMENGEIEEQLDVNGHEILKALHEARELDDCLDALDRDFCIGRSQRREKNEETGRYEYVGRKTYMPYAHNSKYPTFEIYTMPGGAWHFVVDAERMEELISEFLDARSESEDSNA